MHLSVGYEFNVLMFSYVFHCLIKHRVIYKLKEVLFEIVLCLGSKLGNEIDVGFQPCRLTEFNGSMNLVKN